MNIDKATSQEDKAKFITKFFDCTEAPIKEWIAEFLQVDVKEVFPDYNDVADVVGYQLDGKHYNTYVSTLSNDVPCCVDATQLKTDEKLQKACSILYDAVFKVFASVITTAVEPYVQIVKNLRPIFEQDFMRFKLHYVNGPAEQLQMAIEQRNKLGQYISSKEELTDEDKKDIVRIMEQLNVIFSTNTQEVLETAERECVEKNEKCRTFTKLYIVSEIDNYSIESSMERLPVFGLSFQDPDEETYIDKLKSEYKIT